MWVTDVRFVHSLACSLGLVQRGDLGGSRRGGDRAGQEGFASPDGVGQLLRQLFTWSPRRSLADPPTPRRPTLSAWLPRTSPPRTSWPPSRPSSPTPSSATVRKRLAPDEPAIGVRMGQLFEVAKAHTDLPLDEVEELLEHPAYEPRMAAMCILDFQARRSLDDDARRERYDLYLRRHDRITTWDMVDRTAPASIGRYLVGRSLAPLRDLAVSPDPLRRRTPSRPLSGSPATAPTRTTRRASPSRPSSAADPEPMVHQAVGIFLKHAGELRPRGPAPPARRARGVDAPPALRLATEKLSADERAHYRGGAGDAGDLDTTSVTSRLHLACRRRTCWTPAEPEEEAMSKQKSSEVDRADRRPRRLAGGDPAADARPHPRGRPRRRRGVKWVKKTSPGTPVWEHDGIICTGEPYKAVVKLTFMKGASLPDPAKLFNSSLDGTRRARHRHQGGRAGRRQGVQRALRTHVVNGGHRPQPLCCVV